MGILDEENDQKEVKGNTQAIFFENLNKVLQKMDKLLELMIAEMEREAKWRNQFREKIIQELKKEDEKTFEIKEKMIKEMQEIKTIVAEMKIKLNKE